MTAKRLVLRGIAVAALATVMSCPKPGEDPEPLPVPAEITVVVTSSSTARITWSPVPGAEGYNLCRSFAGMDDYGYNFVDYARCIEQTSDLGYVVTGCTEYDYSSNDLWVVKLGADGAVTWQKRYGGSGDEDASSVRQTPDGGVRGRGDDVFIRRRVGLEAPIQRCAAGSELCRYEDAAVPDHAR